MQKHKKCILSARGKTSTWVVSSRCSLEVQSDANTGAQLARFGSSTLRIEEYYYICRALIMSFLSLYFSIALQTILCLVNSLDISMTTTISEKHFREKHGLEQGGCNRDN